MYYNSHTGDVRNRVALQAIYGCTLTDLELESIGYYPLHQIESLGTESGLSKEIVFTGKEFKEVATIQDTSLRKYQEISKGRQ
jgi:hypothetical protein